MGFGFASFIATNRKRVDPRMLTDRMTITRPSMAKIDDQVMTPIYPEVGTDVPCRIMPVMGSKQEATIIGRWPDAVHIVIFQKTQDVKMNDRTNDGSEDYEVIDEPVPHETHLEVVLRRKPVDD
ncbi:hypothetical protein AMJ39_09470 [candidate division TA06 bacterium DG_24]|uniref:Uncharacterized protein n=1 Tax=candidate division TA06 bacterium DG_24 TaxID=1703770 RepID=A0A0S7WNF3_UNCT6|nr:MAG: hypothetical protein AMJ39_09470 [candidate division TA06 bacterium DG_24]